MIYLYDSNETNFSYNGKPLPAAYDVDVSCTLNGEHYVVGKYPLDNKEVYKKITEDRIIKVHTLDGMQPFRIVSVSKYELYIEFEAWPLFYADMRNKLVKPINISDGTGQAVLNRFRNNLLIDPPFSFYSDITDTYDYYTQDESERESNPKQLYNALDVFKDIVATWGGEVWIRGYEIRLNERIGTDTEAMLYEKKNISEFIDTTNIKGIVTRLHGKSEWQDERNEDGEDGEKHLIEVTVDSPLINSYGGVVFEQQFTNNELRTEQELKDWLEKKFNDEHIDKPERSIEVTTNIIGGIQVGFADTLLLKYTKHETDMRIKVVGYQHDGFANELKGVVLGQPKQTSVSSIGNTITDLINNVVKPLDRKATIAMSSADGKNTVFHGTVDPNTLNLNAKENDTYFRTMGSETQIWRHNGTLWELVMDTSDTTKNAREIEAVIEQAEADKQALETEINQTYEDAVAEADRLAAIRDNGITIEAGQIIAGTIDTARLDAVSIVTSGLYANVIKSEHIQADNALFDKLFTSTLATDRLSAQTAWIKNGMFANASIDGAKITDATIGSAKIANLDVSKISGNITNFIQSYWNSAVGGGVSISGATGVRTQATSGEESRLEHGGIRFYDRIGWYRGRVDSSYSNDGTGGLSIFIQNGSHFSIVRESTSGFAPILWLEGYSNIMRMNTNVGFQGNAIQDIMSMRFSGGNAAVRRQAVSNVEITTHGENNTAVLFGQTTAQFYRSIDMNGNNITNQSDIRLKTNVEDSNLNALGEIERLRFIEYDWDKGKSINKGKPTERQFGLIAQYTPFLQTKAGESESYLSVDLTKQINLNSKATQELLHYTRLLEERIEVLESERTSA